jgi:hypothetical protein
MFCRLGVVDKRLKVAVDDDSELHRMFFGGTFGPRFVIITILPWLWVFSFEGTFD